MGKPANRGWLTGIDGYYYFIFILRMGFSSPAAPLSPRPPAVALLHSAKRLFFFNGASQSKRLKAENDGDERWGLKHGGLDWRTV